MTELVVQKFGGSVLKDRETFIDAARHIADTVSQDKKVVAVVSARSGLTDQFLSEARSVNQRPDPELLDLLLATGEMQSVALLAMALDKRGLRAEAIHPWQIGIHTDGCHGRAKITRINPLSLQVKLSEVSVVIVPGFLGRGDDNRLTTLGRGGSDLTAVALSDVLHAKTCEFFKDVPGYFSADPHLAPNALHRLHLGGEDAYELSRFGCRFLQDRAIAWAVKGHCRVLLRALNDNERATVLTDRPRADTPRIVAMTHCDTPPDINPLVSPKVGSVTSLLSMVGPNLGNNNEIEIAVHRFLVDQKIHFTQIDGSSNRLTFAVPTRDLIRAQRTLHDHFVLAVESKGTVSQ